MTKREFLICVIATFVSASVALVEAQQSERIPRIGFLPSSGDAKSPGTQVKALQKGLRDLGYVEGRNILVEYRFAEGKMDRIQSLVAELFQLKVDMLVGGSPGTIQEARKATKTVPIVFVTTQDPVAAGYVDSLARLGGNVTGITRLTRDLSGKRLELLKEAVPTVSLIEILWSGAGGGIKGYEVAARILKMAIQSLEVQSPNPDFQGAFQVAKNSGVNALVGVTISGSLVIIRASRNWRTKTDCLQCTREVTT